MKIKTRSQEELEQDLLLLEKLKESLPLKPYEDHICIAFSKPEFVKRYKKGMPLGFTIGALLQAIGPLAFIIGPPIHIWMKITRWLKPSPLQNPFMIKEEAKLLRYSILLWWINLIQWAVRKSPEKKIALNSKYLPEGYAYKYLQNALGDWEFTESEQRDVVKTLCDQIKESLDDANEVRLPDRCVVLKEDTRYIAKEISE